jgi:hypothetical protein
MTDINTEIKDDVMYAIEIEIGYWEIKGDELKKSLERKCCKSCIDRPYRKQKNSCEICRTQESNYKQGEIKLLSDIEND